MLHLSKVPGRKFWITTSARAASRRKISRPADLRKSSVRLRLLRLTVACRKLTVLSSPVRNGRTRRPTSPSVASTLTTSAPRSASRHPHIGPAQLVVASSTRIPCSGPARSLRASLKNSVFCIEYSHSPHGNVQARIYFRGTRNDNLADDVAIE